MPYAEYRGGSELQAHRWQRPTRSIHHTDGALPVNQDRNILLSADRRFEDLLCLYEELTHTRLFGQNYASFGGIV
jgi:hypothetical protein